VAIGSEVMRQTGSEGPELEGQQVEMKSKAAQTKPKKLIRRTCPGGHGSDGSGPKWHAPPCSCSDSETESAAQKKSFRPQRRGYSFPILLARKVETSFLVISSEFPSKKNRHMRSRDRGTNRIGIGIGIGIKT